MNKTNYPDQPEAVYDAKSVRSDAKRLVLWREVLMAYASPAIMAGAGGFITADKALQIRAFTSIGGASAVFALLIGLWLSSQGGVKSWLARMPHLIVVGMFAAGGASFGLLAAWAASGILEILKPAGYLVWSGRLQTDLPLSATIASSIISWRWRRAAQK